MRYCGEYHRVLVLHFYAKSSKRLVYLPSKTLKNNGFQIVYHCTLGTPLSMAHNNYLPNNQINIFRIFLILSFVIFTAGHYRWIWSKKKGIADKKNTEDRCYKIYRYLPNIIYKYIVDSKVSDECIDFSTMCVFYPSFPFVETM